MLAVSSRAIGLHYIPSGPGDAAALGTAVSCPALGRSGTIDTWVSEWAG